MAADDASPSALRLSLAEIWRLDAEFHAASAEVGVGLRAGVLSPNAVAVAGLDGYLFISNGANYWERQYLGEVKVDPSWVAGWLDVFARRQAEAQRRGLVLWNLIVPEKQSVVPEKRWGEPLPDGGRRPLLQLLPTLGPEAQVLYGADALIAAGAQAPTYFRRNSHWTPSGCCAVMFALLYAMGVAVDAEALRFAYSRHQGGQDLPVHFFEAPTGEEFGLLAPAGEYSFNLGSLADGRFTGMRYGIGNPAAPDARRVIVFGDSFSYDAGFAAALSAVFQEVVFIWSKDVAWAEVESYRADLVIWESAERFLATLPSA
jgi:hypothetical protein